jgi:hypothetical protein
MDRGRMGQDELDHADIDADCDRAGALRRAVVAEANEALTVERHHVALAELPLQHLESCCFGAQRSLADVAHVVDMKVDEVSEGFRRAMRDLFGVSSRSIWRSASMAQPPIFTP